MKKKHIFILLLCIIFSFLILITCAPKKKTEENIPEEDMEFIEEDMELNEEIEEEEMELVEETEKEPFPIKRTGRDNNENDNTQETFKLEQVKQPEIKSSYTIGSQKYLSFLPQLPGKSIQPEDFSIGSLYNEGDSSWDAVLIGGILSDFLNSLKQNKIKTSLLYEGEESELYRLLTYHLENKNIPRKYRIGEITIEDMDKGFAIVRIFGKKGRTDGEIYVRKKQNKWHISDMQINFYELEIPAEKSGEKFMPATYHWIIQGM